MFDTWSYYTSVNTHDWRRISKPTVQSALHAALLVIILPAADSSPIGDSHHVIIHFILSGTSCVSPLTRWMLCYWQMVLTTLVQCRWADDEVPVLMSMTCVSHSNRLKKGTLCNGLSLHCLITKWRLWNASAKSIFSHRGGCVCVIFCTFYLDKCMWFVLSLYSIMSLQWRSWFWHCATSRKVTGLIPDGVIWIFHWHNPSGRTMALGLTHPLTEMNTRNISWE